MGERELVEDVTRAVASEGSVDERAQRAADVIRERTGRRWVGIYHVGAREVANVAWSGAGAPAHPTFAVDRGLTGAAIRSRTTVLANDVASDPRYLTNQQSTGSELIVPVVVGDEVVGTLDVEDPAREAFDDEDRRLFEEVAAALVPLFR